MAEHDIAIECPECGQVYRWTANVAGLPFRCRCGQVMWLPDEAEPAGGGVITSDDPAAAREEPGAKCCPRCLTLLPIGATLCDACRYDFDTGMMRADPAHATDELQPLERYQQSFRGRMRRWLQWQIPVGITITGLVSVLLAGLILIPWHTALLALLGLSYAVAIQMAWGLVALAALELFTGAEFGPWPTQAAKLAAISVIFFWSDTLMFVFFEPHLAVFGSFLLGVVLGVVLVRWFFELNWSWTFIVILAFGCCHSGAGSLFHPIR